MDQLKERFKKIMVGRYGMDQLSIGLLIIGMILIILTLPIKWPIMRFIALILILFCYYRLFSKKLYKRQQENFKFIRFCTPIYKRFNVYVKRFKERKTHRYFKCPVCKQILRVPRGKGKLAITCPKCKHILHKRS